jgi:hypothetical protein
LVPAAQCQQLEACAPSHEGLLLLLLLRRLLLAWFRAEEGNKERSKVRPGGAPWVCDWGHFPQVQLHVLPDCSPLVNMAHWFWGSATGQAKSK